MLIVDFKDGRADAVTIVDDLSQINSVRPVQEVEPAPYPEVKKEVKVSHMQVKETPEKKLVAREARHITYCPPPGPGMPDYHVVKELLHYDDGSKVPNVALIKDFKRPYWITKTNYRNHKQKKEWERKDRCQVFHVRQCDLVTDMARRTDQGWKLANKRPPSQREIQQSPYIYGSDISSSAILKYEYMQKAPDIFTPFEVSVFDIETNVIDGSNDIMMATLAFGNKLITAVRKDFFQGQAEVLPRIEQAARKYIGEYIDKRQIDWEVVLVDTSAQVVIACFEKAHIWKPDFVAIWNIDFDLPKCLDALEKEGYDPGHVFSDPKVPRGYRNFKYKQGSKQKVTASGKITPIKPAAQWHTATVPASFYFIDAMCVYRQVRTGKAEEQSYALDAILDKVLGIRKLKFTEADGLVKLEWHQFMQARHPFEYVIYNMFDCISVEELDEKTTDLAMALPLNSEHSDFGVYNSQPRRLVDKLHFFVQEFDYVFGSTSDQMETDFDKETIGLDGWIVTLPAHLVADNGLCVIKDMPWLRTNIRGHVGDLDVSAAYPTNEGVFNISKATTYREVLSIEGVPESVRRAQGINLSGGHTNAVEFCTEMFGMPTLDELYRGFIEDIVIMAENNPTLADEVSLPADSYLRNDTPEPRTSYIKIEEAQ